MIYEASFSGIIRIILWILVISFLIRLVARLALPHVIKKAEERMRENMNGASRAQRPPRKEGEVTIEKESKKTSSGRNDDYVDYVEIKD